VTDVPAEQESALASGPSLPDPSTIGDIERIFAEYTMLQQFPSAVRRCVEEGKIRETPKEADPVFANAYFVLLLGMDDLFHPSHFASEAKRIFYLLRNSTDETNRPSPAAARNTRLRKTGSASFGVSLIFPSSNAAAHRGRKLLKHCVFAKMRSMSPIVLGSGNEGPEASADFLLRGHVRHCRE